MSRRFVERRRFSVEGIFLDIHVDVESKTEETGLREMIQDAVLGLVFDLQKKIWSNSKGNLSETFKRKSPVEQLADLAAEQDPGRYWRPIELAALAIEANLFNDLFAGHVPGQRLNRRTASAFGKRLVASSFFSPDGVGHSRRYFLNHGAGHGRHHGKTQPAPLDLFVKG